MGSHKKQNIGHIQRKTYQNGRGLLNGSVKSQKSLEQCTQVSKCQRCQTRLLHTEKLCTVTERERKKSLWYNLQGKRIHVHQALKRKLKARKYWKKTKQIKNKKEQFAPGRWEEAMGLLGSIKTEWPEMDTHMPALSTTMFKYIGIIVVSEYMVGFGRKRKEREVHVLQIVIRFLYQLRVKYSKQIGPGNKQSLLY